jgi:hypothetical protein
LITNSLADSNIEVSEAAYQALVKLSGNQEVCDTLLQLAKKSIHRKDDGQAAAPLLAALLNSNLPSVQRQTNDFLDKFTASRPGVLVVMTLADELGKHHDKADIVPLARLAKTKVFADEFGVRRAIVQALAAIPDTQAIGALIEIMDKVGGEAEADAAEHLTEVTGQVFGMDAAAWKRWWEDSQTSFEFPKRKVTVPYRSVALNAAGDYYGLPVFAERMVFVLDTSGSMTGPRIVAAKRELTQAISRLADHVHFGIVVFNGTVSVWQHQLVQATAQSKQAAAIYVNSQTPQSNTASYDALETALGFDTEAIYFLSDGAPFGGKIEAPADIITAITGINKTRRISIYTIGIGAGFPGSPLDLFLKTLAEENLGLYRRVDE